MAKVPATVSVRAIILACFFLAALAGPSLACTLWSAAGDSAGGGTLLAKNRDFSPDSVGKIVLVRPEDGSAYLGYRALVKGREQLVAGVNEAGLSVVSATASSLPRSERDVASKVKALMARILTQTRSVDEALAHMDWFAGHAPVMYMLADGRKTAWVEVGPDGRVAWREADQKTLAHTNHFLSPDLLGQNVKEGVSSHARLARITELLSTQERFTLGDFERFGNDRAAGPDNSIFRTGSTPESTRTMAKFLVQTVPGQPPVAAMTSYDDPNKPWTAKFVLDRKFWEQIPKGSTKTLAPE